MINRTKLQEYLTKQFRWYDYIKLIADYGQFLPNDRTTISVKGESEYQVNNLIDFVFRLNPDESYNDVIRNNDLKVLVQRTSLDGCKDYFFDVTADPKTKKTGIAHFLPQIYRGNIGLHRAIIGRVCIRSDYGCWFFRTGDGKAQYGQIGLNQHNSSGFFNSSLGCIVSANEDDYKNIERPLLKTVTNKTSIPCCIISQEFTESYFKI